MKAGKNIKKWTEPLTYIVLVAAFGFLSTMATHAGSDEADQDKDLVSFSIENDMEAMLGIKKDSKKVSL